MHDLVLLTYDSKSNQNEKLWLEELVALRTEALENELKQHKTVAEELKKSVSLLTATLESTADGILVVDKTGKIINYNRKFVEFWGIPETIIATCNDEKLLCFVINQLKDPESFLKKVKQLYSNDAETSIDILEFNDGRTFERFSQSQRIEGECVGRVWCFRDITGRKHAEDALLQSRMAFQNYFQNCSVGMSVTSPEKKWLEVNQSLCLMLGYSMEDLVEKTWNDLTYPEDVEKNLALLSDMTNGKINRYDLDKRFIKKDGSILYVLLSAVCERNLDGSIHHLLASYIDVTEQKLAEEALKASEALYRNLVEKLPDGVYKSTHDGKFVSVNPAMVSILGYDNREDLMAIDIKNELYFEPQDRIRLLSGAIEDEFDVYKLKRKDGSEIWVEDHSWFNTDDKGNIVFHEGIIRDITDRKRVDDQLRSLSRAVDQNPVSIVITDISGQIEYVNPKFSELTGYSPEEVIGKSPGILKSGATTPAEYTELWKTILSGCEWQGEFINKKKSGEEYFENALISPIKDENGIMTHFLAVKEDITDRKRAEETIREMNSKLAHAQQLARIGNWESNLLSGELNWSAQMYHIMGLPPDTPVNIENVLKLFPPEESERFWKAVNEAINEDVPYSMDFKIIRSDGSLQYIHDEGEILRDEHGTAILMFGTTQDITERKQTELALQESHELNRSLLQSIPFGMDIVDENGNILFQSENLEKLFGPEAIGRKCWSLYCDNQTECMECPLKTGINIGKTEISESQHIFGGKTFQINHTGMLFKGKKAILEIFQDITEKKEVETRVKLLAYSLEGISDCVSITDNFDTLIYVNDSFLQTYGYAEEELIGKHINIVRSPEISNVHVRDILPETIEGGWRGEIMNKRKDGTLFPVLLSASVIKDEYDHPIALIGVAIDISEMKKNREELIAAKETAEESNRLKSAFLATMNHELRTPLNHILGFSELIMSGVATEDNVSFASSIQASGQSLLSIIEDVFDLALVEQEHIKLREQTFSLMDHFMENKASFDNILTNSGKNENIRLIFHPDTRRLTSFVTTDRSKINQILTHLFKNAVKFTQKGTIEFGYKVENESSLMFYVKDTGIGIPTDIQSIIFDFFRQGDDSSTRVYGGIGIGLAISQKITKILKGELKVDSEMGVGSTFSLTIPVQLSNHK